MICFVWIIFYFDWLWFLLAFIAILKKNIIYYFEKCSILFTTGILHKAGNHPALLLVYVYIDGLVQDYRNSSALAMQLLQSYTKPLIWWMDVDILTSTPDSKDTWIDIN